jgi:hypothetical protein
MLDISTAPTENFQVKRYHSDRRSDNAATVAAYNKTVIKVSFLFFNPSN